MTTTDPEATAAASPFQAAVAVIFVAVCAVIGAVFGLGIGLLVLGIGGAIMAGVMRARPRLEP